MAKVIMNDKEMLRALTRLSYEIVERNKGVENILLLGIETRGVYLAKRIAERIAQIEGSVAVKGLDIKPYRDDWEGDKPKPAPEKDLTNKKVILVDDV
ncbi:phosphoribosyltransferase family protein, partial [Jeotgalibaca porci]|uniref:phosphoribosyltransferase family protein n=1 Tax=Jeotgalibaca porci TaxID=1868793 RepID=UPI0035A0D9C6